MIKELVVNGAKYRVSIDKCGNVVVLPGDSIKEVKFNLSDREKSRSSISPYPAPAANVYSLEYLISDRAYLFFTNLITGYQVKVLDTLWERGGIDSNNVMSDDVLYSVKKELIADNPEDADIIRAAVRRLECRYIQHMANPVLINGLAG
jgi:hypothetical protein